MAGIRHHIVIIDQDLSYRDYLLALISGSNLYLTFQVPQIPHCFHLNQRLHKHGISLLQRQSIVFSRINNING